MAERGVSPRRRRWPWVLLVLLVLVVGAAWVGDGYARSYAERTVARKLTGTGPFTTAPTVRIGGTPFLTQALRGSYDDVAVEGSGLTIGELRGVRFRADLRGVRVPLSDVLSGSVSQVPVARASGEVVIPYGEFARQTGIADLRITESGGRLTVTAPVPVKVAFLDETFDVVADGSVAANGADLALAVDNIRVAGVSLPQVAVRFVQDYLANRISLPDLPYGLRYRSVTTQGDGLHVAVDGTDLTIRST